MKHTKNLLRCPFMSRITPRLPLKLPLKFYSHNCNWPTNLYFRICWTNIFFEASCCNSSGKCDDKKSTPRITRGLSLQVPTKIGITQFQDLSRQIFALRPSVANICLVPAIHYHHVVLMLTDDDTSACWSFFWHRFYSGWVGEACHPESHDCFWYQPTTKMGHNCLEKTRGTCSC